MQWDHNNHYHSFLLKQIPRPIERALDIGCGHGAFAGQLADLATNVDAIDANADVLHVAHSLQSAHTNLNLILGDFMGLDFADAQYDVITSLASIHHMDFVEALEKMKRLLRPGGVLVILGLYREASAVDYLVSAASIAVNFVYRHLVYQDFSSVPVYPAPVKDPSMTLGQIQEAAGTVTPKARIRRHLLWRYSLIWQKPIGIGS